MPALWDIISEFSLLYLKTLTYRNFVFFFPTMELKKYFQLFIRQIWLLSQNCKFLHQILKDKYHYCKKKNCNYEEKSHNFEIKETQSPLFLCISFLQRYNNEKPLLRKAKLDCKFYSDVQTQAKLLSLSSVINTCRAGAKRGGAFAGHAPPNKSLPPPPLFILSHPCWTWSISKVKVKPIKQRT